MSTTALPAPTKDLAKSILGIWKLRSRVDTDAGGQRRIDPILGADPLGILSIAPGYFAAQFMKRDRSTATSAPQQPFQGQNNSVAVDGYDAYFGTYELDPAAGTFTTTLEGSVAPANIGKTFVRDIRAQGDELIIQLSTTATDGTPVTRRLTFGRVG